MVTHWANVTLTAESPLAVTTGRGASGLDMVVARDGAGDPYVPATALAGVLRAAMRRAQSDDVAWWGGIGTNDHASRIELHDATLDLSRVGLPVIRDGVVIDRRTGAAAPEGKYDLQAVPAGATLQTCIAVRAEDPSGADAFLTAVLGELVRGVRVGRGTSRGFGQIRLKHAERWTEDLRGSSGAIAAVAGRLGPVSRKVVDVDRLAADQTVAPGRMEAAVGWKALGPVMVRAGMGGVAIDDLPLVERSGDRLVLVLPGSSIKGVLRSWAERIVRTLVPSVETQDSVHDQLAVPLVARLFGAVGDRSDDDGSGSGWRGALSVDDTRSLTEIEPDSWERVAAAADTAEARAALDAAGLGSWEVAHHVAIDRWTGGASDGALFTVLEPWGVEWDEMRLDVDLARLGPDATAALGLLCAVMRDLACGRIALGAGSHRGMGAVSVERIVLEGVAGLAGVNGPWALTVGPSGINGDPEVVRSVVEGWRAWCEGQR